MVEIPKYPLITSSVPVAPLRRSSSGAYTPVTAWLLYADHGVAPIRRSLTPDPVRAAQRPRALCVPEGCARTAADSALQQNSGAVAASLAADRQRLSETARRVCRVLTLVVQVIRHSDATRQKCRQKTKL